MCLAAARHINRSSFHLMACPPAILGDVAVRCGRLHMKGKVVSRATCIGFRRLRPCVHRGRLRRGCQSQTLARVHPYVFRQCHHAFATLGHLSSPFHQNHEAMLQSHLRTQRTVMEVITGVLASAALVCVLPRPMSPPYSRPPWHIIDSDYGPGARSGGRARGWTVVGESWWSTTELWDPRHVAHFAADTADRCPHASSHGVAAPLAR